MGAPMRVDSVSPKVGPISGGTLLTLLDLDLGQRRRTCRWRRRGSSSGSEQHGGGETLSTVTTGSVLVGASFDGTDVVSSEEVTFAFIPVIEVENIYPSCGAEQGGTQVMLFGNGFLRTDYLSCSFGDAGVTSATWLSPFVINAPLRLGDRLSYSYQ